MSEQIKKEWNEVVKNYGEQNNPFDYESRLFIDDAIIKEIGELKNKTILDVGCGNGDLVFKLYDLGATASGIDISDEVVKIAQDKYPALDFAVYDITKGPLEEKFDVIIMELVVMFIQDIEMLLRSVKQSLEDDGKIIIAVIHPFAILQSGMINSKDLDVSGFDNYFIEQVLKLKNHQVDLTYFSRSLQWYFEKFKSEELKVDSFLELNIPVSANVNSLNTRSDKNIPYIALFELIK